MATLTITEAQNNANKKDGTPIVDSKGNAKFRSVIKTIEHGDKFLTGFVYRPLSAGDVIDAKIEIETYKGEQQLRFSIIPGSKEVAQQVQSTQNTSDVMGEMKTQTVLLKQILEKLEGVYMSISTHQTINAMKRPDTAPVAPTEAIDDFEPSTGEEFPGY